LRVFALEGWGLILISIRPHLNLVYRAPHALRALIQHMGVDHGGLYILVPEQFLHGSGIVAVSDQAKGIGMLVVLMFQAHGPGLVQLDSNELIWCVSLT